MASSARRIYWDSCVYINHAQRVAEHIAVLRLIAREIEEGSIVLVASAFSIVEVSKPRATPTATTEAQRRIIEAFFDNRFVVVRAVDRIMAHHAGEIVRAHNLKPPDAVHLATALLNDVTTFQTFDTDLLKKSRQIAIAGKAPLAIERPSAAGIQPDLFAET